ncbi:PREDICTED: phosphoribosylformylglycinamidine synthase [Nanorana parkeri]|uniref:phosphoribosylformylglycinamidine synthase n=1 Tax=Nanorana parkeri TaxID=125878 RepID=UPI000854B9F2|nr:PREDICTED: phosphoribosylformylglycinamidine synthase [Nanorana parkeri]
MVVLHFYCCLHGAHSLRLSGAENIQSVQRELCYNVNWTGDAPPSIEETETLRWLFSCPFDPKSISDASFLHPNPSDLLVEIGPRLNFSTASSTNAVSICRSIGLTAVDRIECSKRFLIKFQKDLAESEKQKLIASLYDRMTECVYPDPVTNFEISVRPEQVYEVDVIGRGRAALEQANSELGLAFDSWDLDYYTALFQRVGRNPSSVECFDLAQSNSEHSRHWFFKGQLVIDGEEKALSLFDMIMKTQDSSNQNNVIKFCDNSSAIQGREVMALIPDDPSRAGRYHLQSSTRHLIFTAETHNFPTGVAPFSGATTGTGGRIRDVQCTGKGAHVIAGTAGYCFGNLHIPGYPLPWEDDSFQYPVQFARPLEVAIEASNGASDYGNKFGEPVLTGFARSFGLRLPSGERREWVKPIMFSGGIGSMEDVHQKKEKPEPGMHVVKIGGPVYRIGVGGGAASSIQVQGDNASDLDFGAVQRGDAEMEQKMNRAVRACVERGDKNPVCSIHDQGAGGNGNVLKELSEPEGAIIYTKAFQLGDPTLSVLEIWGAEYQESNALLLRPADAEFLRSVCRRERSPVDFVGKITGDGRIVLVNGSEADPEPDGSDRNSMPVDLELEWVLGKMPRKEFALNRVLPELQPLTFPSNLVVRQALDRVLRLPSVASKRYLTNKVDRSVTGLVAQQQCVGPLHTPLADVAVVALSYTDTVGGATAIGEQPIKGLLNPKAGARMAVGEALTNLVFALVTDLKDVKCSGNWMWAAKLPGEGAALYDACVAMCDVMAEVGIAVDGGKDSLSMAARVGSETVKAPGSLVISVYAVCPDITATLTPDLKNPGMSGVLLYVPVSPGQHRMGGSALAQCYSQLGEQSPDLDDPQALVSCFQVTQKLLKDRSLSAGHDVSDGGLITCLLEMAFAGNCGLNVEFSSTDTSALDLLFAEELGLVLEVPEAAHEQVIEQYRSSGLQCVKIGCTHGKGPTSTVRVSVNGEEVLCEEVGTLRAVWEETSFQLERLQANPSWVSQEEAGLIRREGPKYKLTFNPSEKLPLLSEAGSTQPRVAVVREEGSNGDREMAAALLMAGFEVWDVTMEDLLSGGSTLDIFRGLVFVGGFSYADVLGSAKGWAASVKFNAGVRELFEAFRRRPDTFSLGICNGCQLMALLGWVGAENPTDAAGQDPSQGVLLSHNLSGRFESRFVTVKIEASPSILLHGMSGSSLGVWVAHGEGLMRFRTPAFLDHVTSHHLAPLCYVDDQGQPTEEYPMNPNGSPLGIAGLVSEDGRHLAMMPHPERSVLTWQWPWMPEDWRQSLGVSPWMRLFENGYNWCLKNVCDV